MFLTGLDQDFYWTADGDLFLEDDNLRQANSNDNLLLESVLLRRLMSSEGDWRPLDGLPGYAASLTEFIGMPINEDVTELIKSRIINTLISPGGVRMTDLSVDCYPDPLNNSVFIVISVASMDPNSDIPVILGLSYDIRDNKIVPRITNI